MSTCLFGWSWVCVIFCGSISMNSFCSFSKVYLSSLGWEYKSVQNSCACSLLSEVVDTGISAEQREWHRTVTRHDRLWLEVHIYLRTNCQLHTVVLILDDLVSGPLKPDFKEREFFYLKWLWSDGMWNSITGLLHQGFREILAI